MTIAEAIKELCKCRSSADAELHEAIDLVLDQRAQLIEQLIEPCKSFCTHCGRLFPQGQHGIAEFREHIKES